MEVDSAGPGLASTGCHNYVVTAHKPTAVTHSVVANFTGPNDINLITACCTRLEIRTLSAQGLVAVLDVPIYGNVSSLQAFRPRDLQTDLLFILTEKYKFCVLQYDSAKGQLVTRSNGDVADRTGRPTDNGQLGFVDPACRVIGLHLYDGMLKVIPMDERTGALSEAYNVRLEELAVLDMAWLAPPSKGSAAGPSGSSSGSGSGVRPLLCVLHQDPKGARHVKTYEVALAAKELVEGPWQQQHVDAGAGLLIPVPAPLGGVVVVGENVLSYCGGPGAGPGGGAPVSAPLRQTIITAWSPVDPDGSRYLLGDRLGGLHLLVLAHDGAGRVSGLRVEPLGHTSTPSCLSYLDSGLTFVGSRSGDSQLVRISPQPVNQPAPMEEDDEAGGDKAAAAAAATAEPPSYVELVESYPNLGPILDFVVMDLERQGQGQLVTCSGVDGDGSLRVIRNGIGINRQATVELAGIKGVWSLRAHYGDEHDTYLVLTFVGETRLLALNAEEELDEAEIPGFDAAAQTLWCGNTASDHLMQVTSSSVRLVDSGSLALVSEWRPPAGFSINVAAGSPTQVVVATGGGHLVYLEVQGGQPGGGAAVVEVANVTLDSEVACVDVSPLLQLGGTAGAAGTDAAPAGPTDSGSSSERSGLVAVGRWDQTLQLLAVPGLTPLSSTPLGGEVIPRSVLCVALEGQPYCMVGLGDGALHTWRLEPATGALSDRKRVVLGTKPITLRTFRTAAAAAAAGGGENGGARGGAGGGISVFAASDRPTVVYSSNRKLLYSNLNENDVAHLASFHAAAFPHSLAVASEAALTIGTADQLQKLHVRTVVLGEQPRRIAHHEAGRLLGVLTQRVDPDGEERGQLRLLDDTTFDVVASYGLAPGEMPCSLAAWPRGLPGSEGAPGGSTAAGAAGGSAAPGAGGAAAGPATFLVGTVLLRPDEPEPSRGRILVLEYQPSGAGGAAAGGGAVRLVTEKEVKGAAYNVMPFAGDKILASVNNKVTVYRWVVREGAGGGCGAHELASECHHLGNVLALYLAARGGLVVVGDLMRSVSLLSYNAEQGVLEHRAADYNSGWTTAVEVLDDDNYIAADNHCNLYVVRRNADSATDEERARLQVVGEYHTGTFINQMRNGSLVMRLPDSEHAGLPPPLLFAGTDGRLGVVARLPPPLYEWATRLQAAMRSVVRGVGGLDHEQWRAFANDRRCSEARGFVDGDLIESLLDLPAEDVARVAAVMGSEMTAEELTRRVEDLARALH